MRQSFVWTLTGVAAGVVAAWVATGAAGGGGSQRLFLGESLLQGALLAF